MLPGRERSEHRTRILPLSTSPSSALRAPSPPVGEKDGMRGRTTAAWGVPGKGGCNSFERESIEYPMPIRQTIQVAAPPTAPLMLYDGDCNFCKFWIIRWQHATGGRVEYLAAQDPRVAAQFPELPGERFAESIQLIETDGWVYEGAEAVFRSLTYARFRSWPLWLY